MEAPATTGGLTSMWFLARGTGVVSLILLTLVVAIGVANVQRVHRDGWPRFVIEAIHRNAALLAVVFLVVHILSSVIDPFTPIRLTDAIVPFASLYRPVWMGLGAVAFDLLLAVVVTSLFRRRLGYSSWRWIHWTAYACWPIAVVHGLGTGSDTKTKWMLALTAACVLVVVAAAFVRALSGWPSHLGTRVTGVAATAAVPLALLVWLPGGPLGKGWAKRAGTPAAVLAAALGPASQVLRAGTGATGQHAAASRTAPTIHSFQAPVEGTVTQGQDGGGASVHIVLSIGAGIALSQLHFLIEGAPIAGGGVQMTASSVTLGPPSNPHLFAGVITALSGTNIAASVKDAAGQTFTIIAQLEINPSTQTASGTVTATAAAGR